MEAVRRRGDGVEMWRCGSVAEVRGVEMRDCAEVRKQRGGAGSGVEVRVAMLVREVRWAVWNFGDGVELRGALWS